MSEIEIKKSNFKNFQQLKKIMHACFGISVTEQYFRWKYLDNPIGRVQAFEAREGDRVVAFYGLLPELYRVNGKEVKIYQSMDTMTHPNFQKRGLFVRLAKHSYQYLLGEEKCFQLIGLPSEDSFPGFIRKLEWSHIANVPYLFLPKCNFFLSSFFKKTKELQMSVVREMDDDIRFFLANKQHSQMPISPYLRADFFSWRVFKNPRKKFTVLKIKDKDKIVGICVYCIDQKHRLHIDYLEFFRGEYFKLYLNSLVDFLYKKEKVFFVYTWCTNPQIDSAYRSVGFMKNLFPCGPFSLRVPIIARSSEKEVNGVDWNNATNFDLQPLFQD